MADGDTPSIFIKKVKKVSGGHHGGAWKIAYADFVTAMMAFFLLLWLLNSVTQEQLEGISNYFAPASLSATNSGAGGILGGQTLGEEGSEQVARAKPTVSLALPPPKTGLGGEENIESQKEKDKDKDNDEASNEAIKKREEQQFKEASDAPQKAMKESPGSEKLKKSLKIDDTPEGLRIQTVDQEGLAMFRSGSADPLPRVRKLMEMVKQAVAKMPQRIAISSHTDSVKFGVGSAYTDWELSVDRANSARRLLRDLGLPLTALGLTAYGLRMEQDVIYRPTSFFVTAPLPCPYLDGRVERRIVTELAGRDRQGLHDTLSRVGFRRSHGIIYAPACPACDACQAVRTAVADFSPSKSQRRVLRRNAGLRVQESAHAATDEQFDLFLRYQNSRHSGGDMSSMDFHDYQSLIEETPVESSLFEFSEPDGRLVGACLVDWMEDGISAVYSFFDPDMAGQSLGTYMILWLMDQARSAGLDYLYLGYWIGGSRKMSYKENFQPLEHYTKNGWIRLDPAG